MECKGKIIWIDQLQSGVSASTGNVWAKQTFCIEHTVTGRYGTQICHKVATISGQDRIAAAQLRVGAEVSFWLDLDGYEHQGKWYSSVRAYNVRNISAEAAFAQMQNEQQAGTQYMQGQMQGQTQGYVHQGQTPIQGYAPQQVAQKYAQQAPQQVAQGYAPQYAPQGENDGAPFWSEE